MTTVSQPDWKALLAQAQPRRKTVVLCLRGDLLADLSDAQDHGDQERVTGLQAEVDAATFAFTITGLPAGKYRALVAQHPDPDDVGAWNADTFPDALVHACLSDPTMTRAEYDDLVSVLNVGQVSQLQEAAFLVCNEVDQLPLPKRG